MYLKTNDWQNVLLQPKEAGVIDRKCLKTNMPLKLKEAMDGGQMVIMQARLPLVWSRPDPGGARLHPDPGPRLTRIQGPAASPGPGAQAHPGPGARGLARTRGPGSPGSRGPRPRPDPGPRLTRVQGPAASPGPGAQAHPGPGARGLARTRGPGSPGSRGPRPRPDPGPRLTRVQGPAASPGPGAQAHPGPGARGLARTRGPGSPGSRGPRPRPDPGPRLTRVQGPAASPGPGAQAHPGPGAHGLAGPGTQTHPDPVPSLTRTQGRTASPGSGTQRGFVFLIPFPVGQFPLSNSFGHFLKLQGSRRRTRWAAGSAKLRCARCAAAGWSGVAASALGSAAVASHRACAPGRFRGVEILEGLGGQQARSLPLHVSQGLVCPCSAASGAFPSAGDRRGNCAEHVPGRHCVV
ncbi:hypothetical protein QTO34_008487 [Cnephaeus nilssonii]|uniref:Uncharacterized protein n=1 Tax=Cnephaeus nilssonii TaxID=3371016 RepID=A0AA40LW10_CNENI|nr:hypothetical protein QTO34_008487 [Eptesicus nilssonii]